MVQLFRCPQGHDWSSLDAAESSVCPICGSNSVSSIGPQLDETVRSGDELPPAPRDRSDSLAGVIPFDLPGYEVIAELGRGGMGVVYKARQTRLNRLVALKLMQSGGQASAEEVVRFRAEAEAVAALQHPNIVQIYDIVEHGGTLVCTLEFVAGGSLGEGLGGKALPPREAVALVATLARAVQHAHERGIVHRDLKPANILLSASSSTDVTAATPLPNRLAVPKITDFGLAKRIDRGDGPTRAGAILGTPCYMAPEQAQGLPGDIGPWTDIYSLGAILYECLTGRPPFRDETAMATLLQVVHDRPVPPRRINPEVPPAIEAICLRCLEKEPPKRYPSARALADDLQRALDDWNAPVAPAAPAVQPRPKPSRPYLLAGAAVVLVLVAAGLLFGPGFGSHPGNDSANGNGADPAKGTPAGPGVNTPQAGTGGVAAAGWRFARIIPEGAEEKFDRLAFPTRMIGYAASREALYRTADGGENWTRLDLPAPGRVFVLHFENDQVGWLGTDRLRGTRDGGRTWTDEGWTSKTALKAVTAIAATAKWQVAAGKSPDGDLVMSRRAANPEAPWSPIDPSLGFWGKNEQYRKWVVGSLVPVGEASAIAVLFSGSEVGGGAVLKTNDLGYSWKPILEGIESDLYHACVIGPGHWWVAGADGEYYRTTDGGETWNREAPLPAESMVSPGALASAPDGRFGLATLWDGRIATTRDWKKFDVARIGDGAFGYSMPSAAVVDPGCAYVLAADGRLAAFRK